MLKLLLDEHLSPRIAQQFLRKWPQVQMASVLRWQAGHFAGVSDEVLLAECHARRWTLVTYDQATIVPLFKSWAEQGIEHGGVILVDDHTIPANDIGGLMRALAQLWYEDKDNVWENAVVYLTRS